MPMADQAAVKSTGTEPAVSGKLTSDDDIPLLLAPSIWKSGPCIFLCNLTEPSGQAKLKTVSSPLHTVPGPFPHLPLCLLLLHMFAVLCQKLSYQFALSCQKFQSSDCSVCAHAYKQQGCSSAGWFGEGGTVIGNQQHNSVRIWHH
ncbi:uncharacterized protein LOC133379526 isoform X2 [Rhineura floridana]|uniref:uncharacterized protein LOC133379526 isoform X2 n=1 Tax=Rhineura floridana TaxID=261503 RepID=UPI002AC803C0|nr:uncharacterized protein LOC133379526 isoform X2 [Rhineura floridana]